MTKSINKKKVVSAALALTMCASLMVGSMAYFTDRASTNASATAGTVSVDFDATGINLLDADGKDIFAPGDGRDFDYSVLNTGNKSIDVKETIILTSYDANGNELNLTDTQSEYEIYRTSDVTFHEGIGYQPNEGATPIEVKSLDGNTITYNRPVYTLSGSTTFDDAEREIETQDGETLPDADASDLIVIFKTSTGNEFQAGILKVDILVEAKQHRNTGAVGFETIQTESFVLSNGNSVDTVPTMD